MKNQLTRLLWATLLVTVVGACASGVKRAELSSDVPSEEIAKLDSDIAAGALQIS